MAVGRRQRDRCRSRVPPGLAALMNGHLARAGEFDDMAMPDLHPAGVIVPAAAAAAAIAARLPARQVAHAMAVAVSLAGGSLEGNRSGGAVKSFQSGFAARSGVAAQRLAAAGVTGPELALEGRYGFYQCFTDGRFDEFVLVGELGERSELSDLRYKPYPSNYYTHSGIDAALAFACAGRGSGAGRRDHAVGRHADAAHDGPAAGRKATPRHRVCGEVQRSLHVCFCPARRQRSGFGTRRFLRRAGHGCAAPRFDGEGDGRGRPTL